MKKIIALSAAALLAVSSVFADTVLKVGATPEPHADILNLVKDDLKAEGIDLQVIEMTDYSILNEYQHAAGEAISISIERGANAVCAHIITERNTGSIAKAVSNALSIELSVTDAEGNSFTFDFTKSGEILCKA